MKTETHEDWGIRVDVRCLGQGLDAERAARLFDRVEEVEGENDSYLTRALDAEAEAELAQNRVRELVEGIRRALKVLGGGGKGAARAATAAAVLRAALNEES